MADLEIQKITDGDFNKYTTSFYKKIGSPPYCCAVLLL